MTTQPDLRDCRNQCGVKRQHGGLQVRQADNEIRQVIEADALEEREDQHPSLRMEFILGDAPHDLIGESVDVALRIGALSDSSIVARKVGTVHRVMVAAPSYLARAGMPTAPRDLAAHTIILGPAGRGSEGWSFRKGDQTITVRVEGRFIVDAAEAASVAAVAGLGVLSTGQRSVQAELETGQLVRLLPDWEMGSSDNQRDPAGRARGEAVGARLREFHRRGSQ